MGIFSVKIEVAKPRSRPAFVAVKKIVVDTGPEATWIKQETLREAGITVRKKDQAFLMANGQTITRSLGYAIIRSGEFETVDEVVLAQEGDLQRLGSRTLEGFNAVVDPRRKKLVAAGPLPAAHVAAYGYLVPGTFLARSWHLFPTPFSDLFPICRRAAGCRSKN